MSWAAIKDALAARLEAVSVGVTNLYDNPSFETDIQGPSSTMTLTRVSDESKFGGFSLRADYTSATVEAVRFFLRGGTKIPVTEGLQYTWSFYAKPASGTGGLGHCGVVWYTAADAFISHTFSSTFNAPFESGDDWTRYFDTAVAPPTAAFALPNMEENVGLGAGERIYFDGLMFNQGGPEEYVDGAQGGCLWDGTAHQSTSQRPGQALKRVYRSPPGTVQDYPCFIIYPPAIGVDRRPSGWRKNLYTVRVRCLIADEKADDANDELDIYRNRVIEVFDTAVTLDGAATVLVGQRIEEGGDLPHGGKSFIGFDTFLEIREDDGVVYQT